MVQHGNQDIFDSDIKIRSKLLAHNWTLFNSDTREYPTDGFGTATNTAGSSHTVNATAVILAGLVYITGGGGNVVFTIDSHDAGTNYFTWTMTGTSPNLQKPIYIPVFGPSGCFIPTGFSGVWGVGPGAVYVLYDILNNG